MAKKVLIADDEANIVLSLEFLMKQAGYDVCSVSDGEEALNQLNTFRPDLVLLDVMLPLRDGFEVCQTIREDPALKAMKVVMLTAKGREVEVAKGLALGADLYMTKPFATRELLSNVRGLLGE
jgi:two-component system, OmpR family, alkaline phosphatase synthesis response regulator PhoP